MRGAREPVDDPDCSDDGRVNAEGDHCAMGGGSKSYPPGRVMPWLTSCRSAWPPGSLRSAPRGAQSDPLPKDPPGAAPPSRRREPACVDRQRRRGRAGRFLSACTRRVWARPLLALIALVAFTLPSGIAQADTLVSNIGQATSSGTATVTSTQSQAQAFTTGSGGGYDLEAVGVEVRTFSGTADDISDISVGIYSVTSGRPGSLVHTLTNPSTISSGVRTFTAPANATLDENKTYFVVVSYAGSASFVLRTTTVNNEDSGAATGWSLADSRTLGSGTSWSTNPNALQIRVKGSDNTPPVLDGAEVNVNAATQVQLEFDEALDSGSLPAVSAFTVTVDGSPRTIDSLTLNGAGTTVTLTVDPAIRPGDVVRVSYTKPSRKPLQDKGGSDVASFTNQAVTNDLPPIVPDAPTNLYAKGGSTGQIDLRWRAPYTGGVAITGYRIEVSNTGTGGWSDLVANTNSTSRRYSHTELNPSDTRHYRVSAINSVGTSDPSNVASATAMNAPPTVISSETSGTGESVILFLDEVPYSNSIPDPSAFTVKVDGNAFTPSLVYFLAPARIVLDIRSAVTVRPGETVTVSYTKPATNPLQDAEGIETESFTDLPVENKIPPIAPDAPTNLHARGVSTTEIGLFWDAPANTRGADITGYRIEVSTTGTGGWSDLVADTGSTSTTYSHTVPSGTTRHYRVSAINSAGTGTPSGVASGNATNTPPGVIRAEIPREGVLRVLFDEALDSTSTPDASAFTIAVEENTYTPLTTVILASPPAIQLVLPANDTVRGGDTVTISYTTPETNPLRDAGGLETAPFTNLPVDNKLPPVKPDAPTNLNAQGVSRTGIDLSWDPPAKTGGTHITGYRIEVSSTGTGDWFNLVTDTGSTSTTYSHTVPSGATRHYRVSAINSAGTGPTSDVASATAINTPPKVIRVDIPENMADAIWLFLDESPDSTSTPAASAFTIKVDGDVRTPASVSFLANPNRIHLSFASNDEMRPAETVTVSYTKPEKNPLRDATGLETDAFTDFPVENKLLPIAPDAPTNLQAKGASTTQIDLFWHAPAYTGGADITGYRIEVSTTGTGGWTDVVANTGSTSTTYSHTVPSQATRYYRVSAINAAGTGTTSDVAPGNAMNTPPTVIGAEIPRGGVLRVLFHEALDSTSTPEKSAFTITVEENTHTPISAVILANPPAIQLVLSANDTVRPGDTVTVSYTKPGTNPLRDAGGLETASFTNLPVDNKLPSVKPDAPTDLNAQATSKTGIELSWNTPTYTGGTDITGYRIEVSTTGTGGWTDLVADTNSTSTTYSHTALSSGDTRHYRVSAINSVGTSDPSAVASATVPDLPPNVISAEIPRGGVLRVLFDEALDSTSTPNESAFTITIEENTRTPISAVILASPPAIQLVLAANDTVRAGDTVTVSYTKPAANPLKDSGGLETPSFTNLPVDNKLPPVKADAPTNLNAEGASETTIDLSWDAPTYTGGADITGYRIEVSNTGTDGWTNLVADTASTSTTYSHSGLSTGDTRHYRVSAINSAGTSGPSTVASGTVPNLAPEVISAEIPRDGVLRVLFDEALDSTSTPDKSAFTITIEENTHTPISTVILASPPAIQLVLASNDTVRPGDTVTVSYTKPQTNPLKDSGGLETPSFTNLPVDNKLPPVKPDAPTNLNAEGASKTTIDLSWDAPTYTGGADITGYRIEVSNTGTDGWTNLVADTASTSTTYSHSGLSTGDTRHYRVSAINSAGTSGPSTVASGTVPNLAPEVISAEIPRDGVLRVLFDEALDSTSTPDKSAFTITIEENTRTPISTVILASPPAIQLVLASNDTVRAGDTVTVSYTKPAANPLKDSGGLETASFTNLHVDNKLPPVKPDAPTNLNAEGTSKTSIKLSWDAPAYTGSIDITGYRIEVSNTGTDGWSDLIANTSSTSTTYSHTGLTSGDTRYYRVSAINSAGTSDPSIVGSGTALDLPPGVIGAEIPRGGVLRVLFDEALDSTSTPDKSAFTVTVEENTHTPISTVILANPPAIQLVLPANDTVRAGETVTISYTKPQTNPLQDAGGLETPSFTDLPVENKLAPIVPDAPTGLTAESTSTTSIDLSWDAPAYTGGRDLTGYRIEVSTDNGNNWSDLVANTASTSTTYSHTGLDLGDTRHYRVSAINSVGVGDPSAVASATTVDRTPPLLDSAIAVVVNDVTTIALIFNEALSPSSVPEKSAFTVKVDGNAVTISTAALSSEQSLLRLVLANNVGVGKTITISYAKPGNNPLRDIATNEVESFTDRPVERPLPDAPAVSMQTGNGFVELSWQPIVNTTPIGHYEVRWRESPDGTFNDWTSVALATSYRVNELTNDQAYQFQVRAVNAHGNGPETSLRGAPTDTTTPTPNRDGSDTLWTATLTVGEESDSTTGYNSIDPGFGSLSTDTFTHDGSTRTVVALQTTSNNRLLLNISPGLNDFGSATLHVGTETFAFDDATPSGTDLLQWTTLPTWSQGQKIAVRLVHTNEPPTAPRNLHAKSHSVTQIDLSWRAPSKTGGSDITGYRIEVSTDGGNNWSDLVADTGSTLTRYMHTVPSGATRHYRVSAINAAGTGPVSNVASATAGDSPPGLGSAVVEKTNSLSVRLAFDEPVDTTSIPDKSAFAVQVEETPLEVTSFTVEDEGSDAGRLGRLGLAARVRPGQTVTLAYTKPGTDPLKDSEGNEMVSFTGYSVTNETSTVFPDLSVRDERMRESGDGSDSTMTFTVRVDTEPDFPVGFYYETEDVTATGGDPRDKGSLKPNKRSKNPEDIECDDFRSKPDYISTQGRFEVGPGESSKEVEVTICDDSVQDSGERFRLLLYSTQLHESIDELGEIGPEGKSYRNANGEDEETASATGTILNSESDAVVSIATDTTYGEEGSDAVFTLRRAGDAETALTVPVTVEETGAMLDGDAPESVTFAAQSREAVLRIATEDDSEDETDSTVTVTVQAGPSWQVAEDAASAVQTVLDNDTAPVASTSSADVTIWSADMTVVEYGAGAIGAGTADLFSNQQGSAGLSAKWLWYDPSKRELKIAFDDGLDDAEKMTLHVGGASVAFPADSGGDSSFTIPNVDVSWTDGATLAARVTKPVAEAVSTDATLASLTVAGATLSPAFDAGVLVYRVEVAAETETVTIAATASDGGASMAYGPGEDADTALADFQISTPSGETLVEVTVTAADGRTARSYRVVLARAAANTAPSGLPEISGTPEVGETLTASVSAIEDADGTDNAVFAYQWLAHDGTDDTAIAGATGATHEVAADDAGKTLTVRATFTDDKGNEETLMSAATEAVVDRRPVAATLSVGDGTAEAGRFRLSIAFGDAVTGLALADLAASRVGGGTAAVSELTETETGRVWTAWVAAVAGRYTVRLPAGAAASGERQSLAAVLAVDVDAAGNATAVAGPVVTAVSLAPAGDGSWTDGDTVRLTLTLSEPVTVATDGGTPTVGIGLDGTARRAAHAGGTGTLAVFTYSVTADDGTVSAASVTADSLALNGGTIRDAAGRDADLEHPGIGEASDEAETESAPVLTGLKLVDTGSGTETALADGDALVLADPANGSWGLVATVSAEAQVGSVVLALTGAKTVTVTDDAAPYSLYGDEDGTVAGAGLAAGSYTLKATAYAEADGAGAELGTLSVSFTVAAGEAVAPDALTASFEGVPEAHGGPGSEAFTFRVRFSQEPRVSYKVLRDESFAVTGGGVRKARRVDGRNDLREIHVEPEGWDDVRVTLAGGRACGTEGAICTADGKVLANTAVATVSGPLALSVADADAQEGADPTLDFVVTLNRAAGATVTVDYATGDGTATAGADYTATSGKLTFDPGETEKTVSVPVLDDAHDDDGETLTLTLSNASGARIRDGEATGTIANSDAIPQAWIARFGRTVADQVLAAVDERLRAARSNGMSVVLGGETIDLTAAAEGTGAASAGGISAGGADGTADAGETARLKALTDWLNGGDAEEESAQARSRSMTAQQVLMGSSFSLAGQTKDGGFAALWGRIAQSRFAGREGTLGLDGEVTTGLLGADYAWDRWTTGLVVSRSAGTGGYRGESAGEIEADVTAVTPWAGYAVSERLSVWGAAGYGTGELTVTPDEQAAMKTDLSMTLAAGGVRATLVGGDGPRLDAVAGARWVRTTSARVSSSNGNMAAATADVSRLTLGLDGSWPLALGEGAAGKGATVTPRLALGLRHDGGDAETGYGVDIAGGVDLALPGHGLTASLSGRGVLTHEAAGLRDRGIAGTLAWTPRPSGRGPSLTLRQTFGAGASSGKDGLLARETLEGLAANDPGSGSGTGGDDLERQRMEARFGYGFAMFGDRFTGTPEIGLGLSQAGRDYSLGWRLVRAQRKGDIGSLELSLEATRRESANDDAPPEHGIGFRVTARW